MLLRSNSLFRRGLRQVKKESLSIRGFQACSSSCNTFTTLSRKSYSANSFRTSLLTTRHTPLECTKPCNITKQNIRSLSSSNEDLEKQVRDATNDFQDLFVEARLSIEDVQESLDTTYFEEDLSIAKDSVQKAIEAFHGVTELLKDDDDKASEFKRANVMKVKQLEEELAMVAEHYLHD
mmetsp:Transcript_13279/g.15185  ORF Transcript_13279/g.15185 Transcript_13279/m.15185 type:complete len:179 (-) Transcript_13279:1964-2500(-)